MSEVSTIHANCVVIGERGVLIRGPSGAGKSSLSLALIELAAARGLFARLVADDRVRLSVAHGRLVAEAPEAIAGLVERRGLGIMRVPHLSRAVVRLTVDIEDDPERMPATEALISAIEGVALARLGVRRGASDGAALTLSALVSPQDGRECGGMALALEGQDGKITVMTATPSILTSGRAGVARGGPRPERNGFCAETA